MVRRCGQCGATVDVDETVLSTTCAFCDSTLVDVDHDREQVDRVVGFVVPRERAARLLASFLSRHWLAPETLRTSARAEQLRQVFVPFYAYDALARTRWSARVGIHWYRTETYTTTENGKTVTKTRQVRETEWFPVDGSHARRWFDHLVSASRGLSEPEANALEPFDLGRALPFVPALTAGVLAEHPTVPHHEARSTAGSELARLQQEVIARDFLPGDTHRDLRCDNDLRVEEVELVLLPVWVAVYRHGGDTLRLLVNGQTGEVVGTVPWSPTKVGALVAAAVLLVLGMVAVYLGAGWLLTLLEGP